VDDWFVHSSSVERQAAAYSTGLKHGAGIRTQANAGVGCRAHAVVVEGKRRRLVTSSLLFSCFIVVEEEMAGRWGNRGGDRGI